MEEFAAFSEAGAEVESSEDWTPSLHPSSARYIMDRLRGATFSGTAEERAAQERKLAREFEAGAFAWAALNGEFDLAHVPASCKDAFGQLSEQGKRDLEQLTIRGLAAARRLAEANVGMAIRQANRYAKGKGLSSESDELIGYALLGLMTRGVPRFNADRGRFTTGLGVSLRNSLREGAIEMQPVQLPTMPFGFVERLVRVTRALENVGETPTPESIAIKMNEDAAVRARVHSDERAAAAEATPEKVLAMLPYAESFVSLESPLKARDEASDVTFGEAIVDVHGNDPAAYALREVNQAKMYEIMRATLDELERYVLMQRYGLRDGTPRTYDQLAEELGFGGSKPSQRKTGRTKVRAIEAAALRKLRDSPRLSELSEPDDR